MEKTSKVKNWFQNVLAGFFVIFLFTFMVLIFGPAEIYFVNYAEFKFVYGEFAGFMALVAAICALVAAIVCAFLPKVLRKIGWSIGFGLSVAGYIQIMFINKGLDLLGMNPEGYHPQKAQAIGNIIFWVVVLLLVLVLAFWKEAIWSKLVVGGAVCLLLVQTAGFASLLISADESAYEYEPEGSWFISGKDQYTVSADDNIIVIILDYFSNQYLESALEEYSDLLDDLSDFTYYNNADCTYFGTYPSLAHMLSGQPVDTTISINDWTQQIWQLPETQSFYQALHDKNYVCNLYTPDKNMLCGMNDVSVLDGTFDNLSNAGQDLIFNHSLMMVTMTKVSCYRMFPYALKPMFYVNVNEYTDVVAQRENNIQHNNGPFHEQLNKGLELDKEHNYYIVQHLMGPHVYETDEKGWYTPESTREETIKGCMVIVEDYLSELKRLGVYDDATIIITADHGAPRDSQVIFFMKEPGETHEEMQVTTAPISHNEFLATIGRAAGIDYSEYGPAVTDIPDEPRKRVVWVRQWRDELPSVPKYNGETNGVSNAYCGYEYTGDIQDLLDSYDAGPDLIYPETDCYF